MKIIRAVCYVYLVLLYGGCLTAINAFGILDNNDFAGYIMYKAFCWLPYLSLCLPVGIVAAVMLLVYDKRKNNRIVADVVLLVLFVLGLVAVVACIAGFIYEKPQGMKPV